MTRWGLVGFYLFLGAGALLTVSVDRSDLKKWTALGKPDPNPYLSCSPKRLVAFGSTQRAKPIAEFAAIVRWSDEASERGKEFGNWGLAQGRHLSCRRVHKTPYLQCKAAGRPCKPKRA